MFTPNTAALLVDQYQLSMMDAYVQNDMRETAVFELFIRRLPDSRNFFVAAGLEQALEYLENIQFSSEALSWLKASGRYSSVFLDYLSDFRFRGQVNAVSEGTLIFPNEPILQVTASLPEAQFIESRLINIIHLQTMVASKAVRCFLAAPGKTLIDFGLRRAHGAEAGLMAARASYLAGFAGTATVLADQAYGIPTYGTMAHSFIEAHEDEMAAFEAFANAHPTNVILLIDTYDTLKATHKVCELAKKLSHRGIKIKGVRIDSGDLAKMSDQVRALLDQAGLQDVQILVSGDLDEYKISSILKNTDAIDGFGVGTHLTTSADVPSLDCVYKLQEYNGSPKRKKSEGKVTWPGKKQVYRFLNANGKIQHDVLSLATENPAGGVPLLKPVMKDGIRLGAREPLQSLRERVSESLSQLPTEIRSLSALSPGAHYPVQISKGLPEMTSELDAKLEARF